jgi:dihydroneopterin aldolase
MASVSPGAIVHIEGLEVSARHGLLPQEKTTEQVFRFDIAMQLNSCPACASDNIEETVDYARVCDDIVDLARSRSYELLEKLAEEVAGMILEKYDAVDTVGVRAEKVAPPLDHTVKAIAVSLERSR